MRSPLLRVDVDHARAASTVMFVDCSSAFPFTLRINILTADYAFYGVSTFQLLYLTYLYLGLGVQIL